MLKRKVQALKMLVAVQRFFNENRNILEQWTPLKAAIAYFSTKLKALNNLAEMADKLTNSVTTSKQELKRILAYELALIAAQAHSWALQEGIKDVLVATNYTEKGLAALSDKKLKTTAGQLLKLVDARNGEMGNYKVEDATFTNANQLLDAFSSDSEAPRNAVAGKSSSLSLSHKEISVLQEFLEESLDRLMTHIEKNNPALYSEYLLNREIIDAGSRETRITGTVTGPDEKPLAKVNITAEETDKGYRYEARSDSNGNFLLKITEAGKYKVVFSHPQYGSQPEQVISMSPGDQPRMNAAMKAL